MSTIEIETKQIVTKKVNISLPFYSKTNCHFFKATSDKQSYCIHEGMDSCSIEQRFHVSLCFDSSNEPSNEQEFNEAFERIQERLRKTLTTQS